jgi:hypothetical protein
VPRLRLSTPCLMGEHAACLGCRDCECHPVNRTLPLALAITVILGVAVAAAVLLVRP